MSAQAYPNQPYRFPLPPTAPLAYRKPLADSNNNVHQQRQKAQSPKQQQQQKGKQPATPPLPRQNPKTVPPSPPRVIRSFDGANEYERVGFLGEGGFARVYEVKDRRNRLIACKVVTKTSLNSKKAKTKLYAEIKIHRSLRHPNIVGFQDCFEDEENVYMTLELCHTGSLMDMLRRRKRFTEPEARYMLIQLIGACHYMHSHQVIHRDLKLGNIFLDSNMNVKVGDFGLAALIENPGERKKTICGTPNYIAPEVLFDTANGHSFEVDTWSIGVIMYTLTVGRPPFQTKEVKDIYKRIRENAYEFPPERSISEEAKQLIQLILAQDPQMRPTLHEIAEHDFFSCWPFPGYIPVSAIDTTPDFRHVSRLASQHNYARVRKESLLDEEETSIAVPKPSSRLDASVASSKNVSTSIAEQEKEFQRAVQPSSPISALLTSARRPLMVNPAAAPGPPSGESKLYRKLQAAAAAKKASPLRNSVVPGPRAGTLQNIVEEDADIREQEEVIRRKELEAQKARIVAQMVPLKTEEQQPTEIEQYVLKQASRKEEKRRERVPDRENVAPAAPPVPRKEYVSTKESAVAQVEHPHRTKAKLSPPISHRGSSSAQPPVPSSSRQEITSPKLNLFDATAQVLLCAFDQKALGKLFRNPRLDAELPAERIFITGWVDYTNKYGMAYALTDGTVGVHFNDSTSMVLSADKDHFDFIEARAHATVFVRKSYTLNDHPEELRNKVYLMKHFENYIMSRLWGKHGYLFQDTNRTKNMDWVQKYLRMKRVVVFQLSHNALQFNFMDHTKLILSSQGLVVGFIDEDYNLTRWTLSGIMARTLKGHPAGTSEEQLALFHRLVDKLHYCKEVLIGIHNAARDDPQQLDEGPALGPSGSKASLR